ASAWQIASALLAQLAAAARPDAVSFGSALRRGPWATALALLRRMAELSCQANHIIFNSILSSLSWQRGLALFQCMRSFSISPTQVSFTALRSPWALALRQLAASSGLEANAVCGNAALRQCRWEPALRLQQWMLRRALQATEVTCGSLVTSCRGAPSQWPRALCLAATPAAPAGALVSICCNSMVSTCERSFQWTRALALTAAYADGITLSACISACEKSQRWRRSIQLLQALQHFRGESGASLPVAYSAATSACEKGSQWHNAIRLVAQLWSNGQASLIPFHGALTALSRVARWELATDLRCLRTLALEPSLETLNSCMGVLRVAQMWSAALAVWGSLCSLEPAVVTFAASDASLSGLSALNALISSCSEPKKWPLGTRLLASAEARDRVSFNSLATVLEKSQRWLRCTALLAQLQQGLQPDCFTWDALLSACQKAAKWQNAISIFGDASPDPLVIGLVLSALAKADARSQWQTLLQMLDELENCREVDASVRGTSVELLFHFAHAHAVDRAGMRGAQMLQSQHVWIQANSLADRAVCTIAGLAVGVGLASLSSSAGERLQRLQRLYEKQATQYHRQLHQLWTCSLPSPDLAETEKLIHRLFWRDQKGIHEAYHFPRVEPLGAGAYGVVLLAKHRKTGIERAVKRIDKQMLQPGEVEALKKMDHPHICRLVEYFETPRHLWLVTELCRGEELCGRLLCSQGLRELEVAQLTEQMLRSTLHCHRKGLLHRDLKPENFLFTGVGSHLKLIDFGFALREDAPHSPDSKYAGTLLYASPQLLQGRTATASDDAWPSWRQLP
ncbi:unnamed protein product, partial [Effrenium voratum]